MTEFLMPFLLLAPPTGEDYALMKHCFRGPCVPYFQTDWDGDGSRDDCRAVDIDQDGDVDMVDFAYFQQHMPFTNADGSLYGDIDRDGFVNSWDLHLIANRVGGLDVPPYSDERFDVDGDGFVTCRDRDVLILLTRRIGVKHYWVQWPGGCNGQ